VGYLAAGVFLGKLYLDSKPFQAGIAGPTSQLLYLLQPSLRMQENCLGELCHEGRPCYVFRFIGLDGGEVAEY
jgi:hypothetical protein